MRLGDPSVISTTSRGGRGRTLKRFIKLSTPPISSPTNFIKLLNWANNFIHAGAYLTWAPDSMSKHMTYSFPVTESLTYALSRYSKLTIIEYNVARFSVFSRSADVVYGLTSSSRFIGSCNLDKLKSARMDAILHPSHGRSLPLFLNRQPPVNFPLS